MTQHPANQARKAAPPKDKATHTPSTSKRIPKPVSTSTRGERTSRGEQDVPLRRGNPYGWPVVEILWVDAVADGGWEWLDPDHLKTLAPTDSLVVGYLAHQTDGHVTVASLINDDHAAHALCIPRSLIVEMRHL
jgi:hypothetical protein